MKSHHLQSTRSHECANLEHSEKAVRLSETVTERLLAISASPSELVDIGPPLPLLVEIILSCGNGSYCELNLASLAQRMPVSHATLKLWMKKLGEKSYITSRPSGNKGMRVELHVERIPCVPVFHDARAAIKKVMKILESVKITTGVALDGALQSIRATRDAA